MNQLFLMLNCSTDTKVGVVSEVEVLVGGELTELVDDMAVVVDGTG
jgi:hypothetical protein